MLSDAEVAAKSMVGEILADIQKMTRETDTTKTKVIAQTHGGLPLTDLAGSGQQLGAAGPAPPAAESREVCLHGK